MVSDTSEIMQIRLNMNSEYYNLAENYSAQILWICCYILWILWPLGYFCPGTNIRGHTGEHLINPFDPGWDRGRKISQRGTSKTNFFLLLSLSLREEDEWRFLIISCHCFSFLDIIASSPPTSCCEPHKNSAVWPACRQPTSEEKHTLPATFT